MKTRSPRADKIDEETDMTRFFSRQARRAMLLGSVTAVLALVGLHAQALTLAVQGSDAKPLGLVMVTQIPAPAAKIDSSDKGYAASGQRQQGTFETTRFTDARGIVNLPNVNGSYSLRLRRQGFKDLVV
jgi:hypothetical protein